MKVDWQRQPKILQTSLENISFIFNGSGSRSVKIGINLQRCHLNCVGNITNSIPKCNISDTNWNWKLMKWCDLNMLQHFFILQRLQLNTPDAHSRVWWVWHCIAMWWNRNTAIVNKHLLRSCTYTWQLSYVNTYAYSAYGVAVFEYEPMEASPTHCSRGTILSIRHEFHFITAPKINGLHIGDNKGYLHK